MEKILVALRAGRRRAAGQQRPAARRCGGCDPAAAHQLPSRRRRGQQTVRQRSVLGHRLCLRQVLHEGLDRRDAGLAAEALVVVLRSAARRRQRGHIPGNSGRGGCPHHNGRSHIRPGSNRGGDATLAPQINRFRPPFMLDCLDSESSMEERAPLIFADESPWATCALAAGRGRDVVCCVAVTALTASPPRARLPRRRVAPPRAGCVADLRGQRLWRTCWPTRRRRWTGKRDR